MPKTDIKCTLRKGDNVFAVIGDVAKALRRGGRADLVDEFEDAAMASDDYDEVFDVAAEYVSVN